MGRKGKGKPDKDTSGNQKANYKNNQKRQTMGFQNLMILEVGV